MVRRMTEDNTLVTDDREHDELSRAQSGHRVSGTWEGIVSQREADGTIRLRVMEFTVNTRNRADDALDQLMEQPNARPAADDDEDDDDDEL